MGLARNAAGWSRRAGEGSVVLFETTKKDQKSRFASVAGWAKILGLRFVLDLDTWEAAFLNGDQFSKETGCLVQFAVGLFSRTKSVATRVSGLGIGSP